jgi:hypothetical protein
VSVTRAFCWKGGPLAEASARKLLEKKLRGVISSSKNVVDKHKWTKQILHIWCRNAADAATVQRAVESISDELKSDTFVLVTVSDAPWIYQ